MSMPPTIKLTVGVLAVLVPWDAALVPDAFLVDDPHAATVAERWRQRP